MWPATPLESLTSQNLLTLLKTISLRPPTASERPFPNGGTSGILPHQSVMTFMAMLRTHSCLLGSLSVQGAQMSV